MKLSLQRKIDVGFGAAVLVLVLVAAAAWWNVAQFQSTHSWVDHTREVLNQLERTRSALLNMQASSRGFGLTGSDDALVPFGEGSTRLTDALRRLRELTKDNPAQQERLTHLEPLGVRAREMMQERIDARRARGLDAVRETSVYLANQRLVVDFQSLVSAMVAEERRLLDQRLLRSAFFGRLTVFTIVGTTCFAGVLVVLAARRVRHDLARRHEAELAVQQNLARVEDLYHNAPCGYHSLDPAGKFLAINDTALRWLGYQRDEVIGRLHFTDVLTPESAAPFEENFDRFKSTGSVVGAEYDWRRKDGTVLSVLLNATVIYDDAGNYQASRATVFDITKQKLADERIRSLHADLELRAAQLENTNRELESFSYSVSHDLRAPLRHIDGFAGLLSKRAAHLLDDEGRRYLTTISKAAKRMGNLIDDLLAFSRIGRIELRMTLVDHDQLVSDVIADGHYEADERKISWERSPLPNVRADASMLRQVWTNLIGNAVKYSSKVAHPHITIGAQESSSSTEHVFFVRDNGVGFDMAYADKLFGVFQRMHSPTEFEGTGIGLANVRRIVARHGGRTWAEARVDQGATFFFSLPRQNSETNSLQR